MHISSSYAKILGETNFQAREIPQSGSKAKTEKKKVKKKKEERLKVGNTNGQLSIATPPRVAHAKPPGQKKEEKLNDGNNNGQAAHGAHKPTHDFFIFLLIGSWINFTFGSIPKVG